MFNTKDKANGVQEFYRKKKKLIIVITFSGAGIFVKCPKEIYLEPEHDEHQEPREWRKWHNSRMTTLLQHIDDAVGLNVPVFVFGYTKMCRGISFRSKNRVPTHMLMSLGRGHNASTVPQTIGRSTFNGKNVLKENGFHCVTVLTTANDYIVCRKMQAYVDFIYDRIQSGDTFSEAVTGAVSCFILSFYLLLILVTLKNLLPPSFRMERYQIQPIFGDTPFERLEELRACVIN